MKFNRVPEGFCSHIEVVSLTRDNALVSSINNIFKLTKMFEMVLMCRVYVYVGLVYSFLCPSWVL